MEFLLLNSNILPFLFFVVGFVSMVITELRIRSIMLRNKLEQGKTQLIHYKGELENRVNLLELCAITLKLSLMIYEEKEDYENALKCQKALQEIESQLIKAKEMQKEKEFK